MIIYYIYKYILEINYLQHYTTFKIPQLKILV